MKHSTYRHGRRIGPDIYDHIAIAAPLRSERATPKDHLIDLIAMRHAQDRTFVRECLDEMIEHGNMVETPDGKVYLADGKTIAELRREGMR